MAKNPVQVLKLDFFWSVRAGKALLDGVSHPVDSVSMPSRVWRLHFIELDSSENRI